jgi:undecaprenyl pyrophosphate synthase
MDAFKTHKQVIEDSHKEVLKRALEVNHAVHVREVANGLWDKKKVQERTDGSEQGELF